MSCNCSYLQFLHANVELVEEAVVSIWYLLFREARENRPYKVLVQHTVSHDGFLLNIVIVFTYNSVDDNWIWQCEWELQEDL